MIRDIPKEVFVSYHVATLGEIHEHVRAIAIKCTGDVFKMVMYLDREPTEDDRETLTNIAFNMDDGLMDSYSDQSFECVYDTRKVGELDSLDAFLFVRKQD